MNKITYLKENKLIQKENTMIIAVDFDGTVTTHNYPDIGEDIGAVPILKKLVEAGHKLILYTMRGTSNPEGRNTLQEAVNWFKNNDIELWGINENPEQHEWTNSPKIYANLYIDDAGIGTPLIYPQNGRPYVDWATVEKYLMDAGYIGGKNK